MNSAPRFPVELLTLHPSRGWESRLLPDMPSLRLAALEAISSEAGYVKARLLWSTDGGERHPVVLQGELTSDASLEETLARMKALAARASSAAAVEQEDRLSVEFSELRREIERITQTTTYAPSLPSRRNQI